MIIARSLFCVFNDLVFHTFIIFSCKTILTDKRVLLGSAKYGMLEEHELDCIKSEGTKYGMLEEHELDCIKSEGIVLPEHYYIYPLIYLAEKNRIATTLSSSRVQKRVNSCVVYINADVNEHNYGLVQKLVMLDTHTFAIIICLKTAAQQLYNNCTNFDEHFIAFLPPRLGRSCQSLVYRRLGPYN